MPKHTHNHIGGLKCDACGGSHGPIVLHSKCHIGSPTWVSVDGDLLAITCAECGDLVTYFTLAAGPFVRPPLPGEPIPEEKKL